MIIGHGAIAGAIQGYERPGFLYFASGVSNSKETREAEYEREIDALLSNTRDKRLVYFSSLCIFYSNSRYARHKLQMESVIKDCFPAWTIMRLGNIDWATNRRQLIPSIRLDPRFVAYDEWRHIVTVDEFHYWLGMIPDFNCEMNVPGERMKVTDVVGRYRG